MFLKNNSLLDVGHLVGPVGPLVGLQVGAVGPLVGLRVGAVGPQ